MSFPPNLPKPSGSENEYVHIRCLIANIHRPKNVSRPPFAQVDVPLEAVEESPGSSDTERSGSVSERSEVSEVSEMNAAEEEPPQRRTKSNSFAGPMLAPPALQHHKKRRPSFLHLPGPGWGGPSGAQTAGPHFSVPRFTVTAPPGEGRRFSHGFAFHGFALRRHSNTVCDDIVRV
ncbi:hypothetical protein RR46_15057 [Papilio xuthus]|uniref:Uncharacterized protein n=1 Tax=Papilio xuthus TaxID=66420 RepID=A0A194PEV4_PAPXU|nr:hypothetical protein RR46_15057 [Papilio xuthus]